SHATPATTTFSLSLHDALPISDPATSIPVSACSLPTNSLPPEISPFRKNAPLPLIEIFQFDFSLLRSVATFKQDSFFTFSTKVSDRKSTRLNSSHVKARMPSSA